MPVKKQFLIEHQMRRSVAVRSADLPLKGGSKKSLSPNLNAASGN
jgi:hypothetical protein